MRKINGLRADRGLIVDRGAGETGLDLFSFLIGAAAGMIFLALLITSVK
jgi:hypothetical protein